MTSQAGTTTIERVSFTCPHCGSFAQQNKAFVAASLLGLSQMVPAMNGSSMVEYRLAATSCESCKEAAIWFDKSMLYPPHNGGPKPSPDLPSKARNMYLEALSIRQPSPRAAAAMLRLSLEYLVEHLQPEGKNLNDRIGKLVAKGTLGEIQKALDIVRIRGNNAVHPGQIDPNDNEEIVSTLFNLINVITQAMITTPKSISALYDDLPPEKLKAIDQRDSGEK